MVIIPITLDIKLDDPIVFVDLRDQYFPKIVQNHTWNLIKTNLTLFDIKLFYTSITPEILLKTNVVVAVIGAISIVVAAIVGVVPELMKNTNEIDNIQNNKNLLDNVEFVAKIGNYGSKSNEFNEPNGIAVNSQGHIYISDKINNRIQIYDSGRNYLGEITSYGDKKFNLPHGIAIDRYDNMYIADLGNNKIIVLDPSGNFKFEFGSFCNAASGEYCHDPDGEGPLNVGDGQFHSPYGIALDSKDNIYVTDVTSFYVQKFTNDGKFESKWGGRGGDSGRFLSPHGITVDSNDFVYVADRGNDRLQIFDSNGNFKRVIDNSSYDKITFDKPNGIIFDKTNNQLYITNGGEKNNFITLTTDGKPILEFGFKCDMGNDNGCEDSDGEGSLSKGDLQFNDPRGIAVDKDKRIYVVDGFNHRIQIFTIKQ